MIFLERWVGVAGWSARRTRSLTVRGSSFALATCNTCCRTCWICFRLSWIQILSATPCKAPTGYLPPVKVSILLLYLVCLFFKLLSQYSSFKIVGWAKNTFHYKQSLNLFQLMLLCVSKAWYFTAFFCILIHLKKASQAGNHPNQEVIYNSLTPGIGGFQPGLESS